MLKKGIIILALLLVVVYFVPTILAETVVLKSGEVIEGEILKRTPKYIKIDTNDTAWPELYNLDEIESISGKRPFIVTDFSHVVVLIFLLSPMVINFLCLFVWEAYPGVGWYAFSVSDVSLKIRLLVFIWFCGGLLLPSWFKLSSLGSFYLLSAFKREV